MHPELAANLSAALIEALKQDELLVDAVKVSEFGDPPYVEECRRLAPSKRLVVHGICQVTDWGRIRPPSIGDSGFRDSIDFGALEIALEVAHPQYISVHLELLSDELDAGRFLSNLAQDAEYIRSLTGLPVHLENTHTLFPKGANRVHDTGYVSAPSFIREALAATGARFLLDIAHAQVAAWHKRVPVEQYLDQLPLDLADEVHVCAPAMVDGELHDLHAELDDEGYRLLGYVMARAKLKTVSLEYGGFGPMFEKRSSREALVEQLRKLRVLLLNVQGGSDPSGQGGSATQGGAGRFS
jgi:hypothetical protein